MQEKLIKLICAAYKLEELYMCDCGCDDDIMEEFILDINKIFSSVSEVKEAADMVAPIFKQLVAESVKEIGKSIL